MRLPWSLAKVVTGGGVPAGTFLRYSQVQTAGGTGPGTILGTVELNITNVNPNYTLDFGGGSKLTNTIAAIYTSGITLSGDASIDSSTAVFTGTGMTISASTAGAKTLTLTGTNTGANTIGGIISNGSDTVGVAKTGAGTWTISGANTYTGSTDISAGTLTIGNAATFTNTSQIALSGTGRLDVNVASQSLAKVVTGGGVPAGTFLRYSQVQTAGGTGPGTILGTVELNITNVNPNYTLDFGGGSKLTNVIAATYNLPITLSGDASIDSSSAVFTGGTAMAISASTAGAKTLTFTGTNTGANTIGGIISNGSDTVGVAKTGAGTWVLAGANTYTGGTTVSAGVLTAAGTASLPGYDSAGKVVFNGGAVGVILGGSGWTTGQVNTLLSNATKTSGALGIDTTNGSLTQWTGFTTGNLGPALGLTKLGNNTLILDQANTYAGTTTVSTGVLNIRNNAGLGGTAGGTTVASGAALELQGGITIGAEVLSLNGTGIAAGGALRNISGDNTYGGLITLAGASRINSDSGTLTLDVASGNAITGTQNLTLGGAGNITVADPIATSTGTLTYSGTGTAILAGNNTYTGLTTVSAGTLTLSGSNIGTGGTTLTAGTLNVNHAHALGNSGTITLTSGTINNTSGAAITNSVANPITIGGNFTFGGANDMNLGTGAVTNAGSRTITLGGTGSTLTLGGVMTNTANAVQTTTVNGAGNALVLGGYALSNNATSRINVINGSGNVTITGPVTNGSTSTAGGLTYSGTGVLTLSGTNTYAGATTVNSGTLNVSATGSINASDVTVIGTGTVLTGGGSVKSLTVNSAAIVAPGDGVGTLAVATGGFATLNSGAVYQWELGSSSSDLVNVTGGVTLTNGWVLKLIDAGGTANALTQYNLFTCTGAISLGTYTIDSSGVDWDVSGASIQSDATRVFITGLAESGGMMMMSQAIPEPCTAMLLVFGAAAMLRCRRVADAA